MKDSRTIAQGYSSLAPKSCYNSKIPTLGHRSVESGIALTQNSRKYIGNSPPCLHETHTKDRLHLAVHCTKRNKYCNIAAE